MLRFLPGPIKGIVSMLLISLNTLLICAPLFTIALVKLCLPLNPVRILCNRLLNGLATAWISINNGIHALTKKIRWHVEGVDALKLDDWYLVISNHQSWADILVLQKIFNRHIPFMKFFLKKELIWVPVIGLGWWALDFPFMKRYSKSYLAKHPEMKGKDMETTRKACEKFRTMPVSIMNFVEGTRFTPEKKAQTQSPFKHLLKPKAGGAGFVLTAMGEQLHRILDVTIVYPEASHSFWDFLCGKVTDIRVHVRSLPITGELLGNYEDDKDYRIRFQAWLNGIWEEKDRRIELMLTQT
ncbi:acyltransferase [Permianibacter sp. IMCC34836]|uniref:acyltransferase n=1 Tax=Permianibacter fluminis TaxID=2738515 RepID=UPI001555870F|nr:acyltransferase [Permianibacter fluminis]NQD38709.1 acyltransferase [Permianibacter fluminis]